MTKSCKIKLPKKIIDFLSIFFFSPCAYMLMMCTRVRSIGSNGFYHPFGVLPIKFISAPWRCQRLRFKC